jgi:hypothetical protein
MISLGLGFRARGAAGGTFIGERDGGNGDGKDACVKVSPRACSEQVDGGTFIRERDGYANAVKFVYVKVPT